jgi:membrane protein DedA with SNARE-associated domain
MSSGGAWFVFDWLGRHTYSAVFVGTLIDASGIPFPGRLLLIAAGAIAASGRRSVVTVIVLGMIAAMVMDHVWYLAGAWGSERVIRWFRRLTGWSAAESDAARDYFARYGAATILVGRFFTSVRAVAWPLAAAHGVGYARFLAMDVVAAVLWASSWVLLGWVVGERWASAAETAGIWMALAGVTILAVAVMPLAVRLWRHGRARRKGRASVPRAAARR